VRTAHGDDRAVSLSSCPSPVSSCFLHSPSLIGWRLLLCCAVVAVPLAVLLSPVWPNRQGQRQEERRRESRRHGDHRCGREGKTGRGARGTSPLPCVVPLNALGLFAWVQLAERADPPDNATRDPTGGAGVQEKKGSGELMLSCCSSLCSFLGPPPSLCWDSPSARI
jgi:hypothetical protein